MSIASQARRPKCPAPNPSTRPRQFGARWTPPPFSFTEFADTAHRANLSAPRETATAGAFGGKCVHLAGLPPKQRALKRKKHRLAGWIARAKKANATAANAWPVPDEPAAEAPKPSKLARVGRAFRKFFGRKEAA